jgi:hypothetical protein
MAVWLAPALKAILPHLGTIVSAAAPAFTRNKADAAANQVQLLQEQVAELQSSASQNDTYIKELATQLRSTVATLEKAAATADARLRWALRLSIAASAVSLIAFVTAAVLLFAR